MQDLCPVCLKSGLKKKIKLLQINLNEAIWACEAEKCVWPFGYEDFTFSPRPVGKTWSCYWDDHKPILKATQNISSSLEVPSCNKTLRQTKNILPNLQVTNMTNSASNAQNTKTISANVQCENHAPLIDQGTDLSMSDLVLSEQSLSNQISDSQLDETKLNSVASNPLCLDASTISMNVKVHSNPDIEIRKDTNSMKEQCSSPVNAKECNKGESVPNIGSLSCTSKMRTDKEISVECKKVVSKCETFHENDNMDDRDINMKPQFVPNTSSKLNPILNMQRSKDLEMSQCKLDSNTGMGRKSNINVTTMRIENLPPIIVSYELPNMQQDTGDDDPSVNRSNADVRSLNKSIKNVISSGAKKTNSKQFAKFSFNALRKKKELNKNDDLPKSSDNNTDLKLELSLSDFNGKQLNSSNEKDSETNIAKEDNCRTLKKAARENSNNSDLKRDLKSQDAKAGVNGTEHVSARDSIRIAESNESIFASNAVNNFSDQITKPEEENVPNQLNISMDSCVLNTSINIDNSIDTALDDFLSNNDEECENINDDWINSLLF